jgi:hypothetical protein
MKCYHPERIIGTFEFEGLPERGHVALSRQRDSKLCLAAGRELSVSCISIGRRSRWHAPIRNGGRSEAGI